MLKELNPSIKSCQAFLRPFVPLSNTYLQGILEKWSALAYPNSVRAEGNISVGKMLTVLEETPRVHVPSTHVESQV